MEIPTVIRSREIVDLRKAKWSSVFSLFKYKAKLDVDSEQDLPVHSRRIIGGYLQDILIKEKEVMTILRSANEAKKRKAKETTQEDYESARELAVEMAKRVKIVLQQAEAEQPTSGEENGKRGSKNTKKATVKAVPKVVEEILNDWEQPQASGASKPKKKRRKRTLLNPPKSIYKSCHSITRTRKTLVPPPSPTPSINQSASKPTNVKKPRATNYQSVRKTRQTLVAASPPAPSIEQPTSKSTKRKKPTNNDQPVRKTLQTLAIISPPVPSIVDSIHESPNTSNLTSSIDQAKNKPTNRKKPSNSYQSVRKTRQSPAIASPPAPSIDQPTTKSTKRKKPTNNYQSVRKTRQTPSPPLPSIVHSIHESPNKTKLTPPTPSSNQSTKRKKRRTTTYKSVRKTRKTIASPPAAVPSIFQSINESPNRTAPAPSVAHSDEHRNKTKSTNYQSVRKTRATALPIAPSIFHSINESVNKINLTSFSNQSTHEATNTKKRPTATYQLVRKTRQTITSPPPAAPSMFQSINESANESKSRASKGAGTHESTYKAKPRATLTFNAKNKETATMKRRKEQRLSHAIDRLIVRNNSKSEMAGVKENKANESIMKKHVNAVTHARKSVSFHADSFVAVKEEQLAEAFDTCEEIIVITDDEDEAEEVCACERESMNGDEEQNENIAHQIYDQRFIAEVYKRFDAMFTHADFLRLSMLRGIDPEVVRRVKWYVDAELRSDLFVRVANQFTCTGCERCAHEARAEIEKLTRSLPKEDIMNYVSFALCLLKICTVALEK